MSDNTTLSSTDKEMLLRMIVKCKKSRKHKPKKVVTPMLEIGGVASTMFADSEIEGKSWGRTETRQVRDAARNLLDS